MIGDIGLVHQQHRDAKHRCDEGENGVLGQREGKRDVDRPGVEQGDKGQHERERCQNKRHQGRPRNTTDHQIGGDESQRQQHQLSKRITRFVPVRSDGHQGAHHAERNRDRPKAGFAETNGAHGLAQPILMMDEASRHRRIRRRHHRQQNEEGETVVKADKGQRPDRPIVRQGMNPHPKVGHGNAEACEVARGPQPSQPVHQHHRKDEHHGDAVLPVDRSR